MSHSPIAGFVAVSIVVIVVPGPSVIYAISRALVGGRRQALLTVLGNAAGVFLQVVVIALGLGLVVTGSDLALSALKLGGAAYVAWLGVTAIRRRHLRPGALDHAAPPLASRPWRDGFVVGATNAKSFVLLATLLPGHVDTGAVSPPVQMLVLGAVFCAIAIVSDGSWAMGAAQARRWLASDPRRLAWASAASGCTLLGLAVLLAAG